MLDMVTIPKPFFMGYLEEDRGHNVFYSQFGNPTGPAIIILHGGPGSHSELRQARGYDLQKYHVITFDQRGCGKSLPLGETTHNTLDLLIHDMERIREKLHVKTWYVAGGSWGSTLALAYAEAHPNHTKGLLLTSLFLARPHDSDWAFDTKEGIAQIFPDVWEKRLEFLASFKTNPKSASKILLQKLQTASEDDQKIITAGVSNWENNAMSAQSDISYLSPEGVTESDIASVKIFLHYDSEKFFLKPNQLLHNAHNIKNIPTILVHGRYDLLCPLEGAWELKKLLSNMELIVLPTSNHRLTAEGEVARKLAFNLFLAHQTI